LQSGTGVPPANHVQDARATIKLIHYRGRCLLTYRAGSAIITAEVLKFEADCKPG